MFFFVWLLLLSIIIPRCIHNYIELLHLTVVTGRFLFLKNFEGGTSLAVQWLRLHASIAGGAGSIPDRGTKIPHAMRCSQKKKKKFFFFVYDFRKYLIVNMYQFFPL